MEIAFVGDGQTWVGNLIALTLNGIAAAYVYSVLQKDWVAAAQRTSPQENAYPETRRLFRYIWVIYGLAMVVGGIQQVLYYILNLVETIGQGQDASLATGLSLLIAGTPLWIYAWRIVQQSLSERDESQSVLRLVFLFILSLIGVGGVLIPIGIVMDVVIRLVLGESLHLSRFLAEISGPLSAAIPFGAVWAYHGLTLTKEIAAIPDKIRQAGVKRLYYYILSFVGLVSTFFGMNALLSFIIDTLLQTTTWAVSLRPPWRPRRCGGCSCSLRRVTCCKPPAGGAGVAPCWNWRP